LSEFAILEVFTVKDFDKEVFLIGFIQKCDETLSYWIRCYANGQYITQCKSLNEIFWDDLQRSGNLIASCLPSRCPFSTFIFSWVKFTINTSWYFYY